mmetsp:Transcript_45656/g.130843  ORF Transcript_45656/g.130843 Transcript_45656/m.130843 type:complete len:206 (-) Transcript_45656:2334-2951(-)
MLGAVAVVALCTGDSRPGPRRRRHRCRRRRRRRQRRRFGGGGGGSGGGALAGFRRRGAGAEAVAVGDRGATAGHPRGGQGAPLGFAAGGPAAGCPLPPCHRRVACGRRKSGESHHGCCGFRAQQQPCLVRAEPRRRTSVSAGSAALPLGSLAGLCSILGAAMRGYRAAAQRAPSRAHCLGAGGASWRIPGIRCSAASAGSAAPRR